MLVITKDCKVENRQIRYFLKSLCNAAMATFKPFNNLKRQTLTLRFNNLSNANVTTWISKKLIRH